MFVMACDTDDGHDDEQEQEQAVVSAANEMVRAQSDIERYTVDLSNDTYIDVRLDDAQGDALGSIRIASLPGRTVTAQLVTKDGAEVSYYAHHTNRPDQGTESMIRIEQGGEAIDLHFGRNAAGEVTEVTYMLAGPQTPEANRPAGADGVDRLVVLRDGVLLGSPEIQAWLDKTSVRGLLDSRWAKMMFLVMGDSGVVQGFAGAALQAEALPHDHPAGGVEHGDDKIASNWRGIHKSPLCSSLITALTAAGLTGAACATCVAAAAALPPSAGFSSIIALPACVVCMAAVGLSLGSLVNCSVYYFNRTTLADCRGKCESWDDAAVSTDEHGCDCTCNVGKCEAASRMAARDDGEVYCSTTQCLENKCGYHSSKCGNGKVEKRFGCSEQCEEDSDCGKNQECVGCQCKPKPKCEDRDEEERKGSKAGGGKFRSLSGASSLPNCDDMLVLPH